MCMTDECTADLLIDIVHIYIGKCCGPFKSTYGALYGKGSQLCGTYMYSEIVAAGALYYFDTETNTAIAYMPEDSQDGWTKAGTWFTYIDKNSIDGITKYIRKQEESACMQEESACMHVCNI